MTAAFVESPRFMETISYGSTGGPEFSTTVVEVGSGDESRNQNWTYPRCSYDAAHGLKGQADLDSLLAFFRTVARGKAIGFRYKDWLDYLVTVANGVLGAGVGVGSPILQLGKVYISGALTSIRPIRKPVLGTPAIYRNGSLATAGVAAGNYALDTATGLVTWVSDASSSASSITVGATTSVVLSSNPGTLVAGKLLYLSGFTGVDANLVNGIAHTINSVSGSGPYTFVLATATTGKTITTGSGLGAKFPQASDTLTWSGEFDVPCRFDTDKMNVNAEAYSAYTWGQIPIKEVRV